MGTISLVRVVIALVLLVLVAGCTTAPATGPPSLAPTRLPMTGNADWTIHTPGSEHAIEGFADRVSVAPGEPVRLFVSTTALPGRPPRSASAPTPAGLDLATAARHAAAPAVIQKPTNTVVAPVGALAHRGHQRLGARRLPVPPRRPRRPALRTADRAHPVQRGPGRDRQRGHHLAGLQPVGRLQPLQRPRRQTARPGPGGVVRPPLRVRHARRGPVPAVRAGRGAGGRDRPGSRWATPPTSTCTPTPTSSTAPAR